MTTSVTHATSRQPSSDLRYNPNPSVTSKSSLSWSKALANSSPILIVDDYPANLSVLERQLGALGYASDAAADGIEALEKVKSAPYCLVITDCVMPKMDGYQLARGIRKWEAATGRKRVAIIACTANDMPDEARKCAAAGMDEFLSKPLDIRRLAQTLARWLPLTTRDATLPPEPLVQPGEAFDRSVLDLACGGDRSIAIEMVCAFRVRHRADAAALIAAVLAGDHPRARSIAYHLRGAARAVGALRVAHAAHALEQLPANAGAEVWNAAVIRITRERERFDAAATKSLAARSG